MIGVEAEKSTIAKELLLMSLSLCPGYVLSLIALANMELLIIENTNTNTNTNKLLECSSFNPIRLITFFSFFVPGQPFDPHPEASLRCHPVSVGMFRRMSIRLCSLTESVNCQIIKLEMSKIKNRKWRIKKKKKKMISQLMNK